MNFVAYILVFFVAPIAWAQTNTAAPAAASAAAASSVSSGGSDEVATSEYKVKLDTKESRLLFGLYGQMSQFSRAGASLMGYNLEGLADYAIRDKAAVQISLNQSLSMEGGISVLFTGLRLGGAYAWWGEFTQRSSLLEVNSQDTLAVRPNEATMLVTDVGIEQYLFNGTDRIVPATGLSLGGRMDKTLWGMRFSAMLRYGSLVISADPVSMITAGVGTVIRF